MAVYTEVTDDALEAFLALYDIGALLSFKGIAEGVENSNYLLRTDRADQGTFILTLYEKRVKAGDLPYFLALLSHLNQRGISCPTPCLQKDGKALGTLANRPAAIFTFLDGFSVTKPQPQHCGLLGRALAEFHLAGQDFGMHRQNALSVGGWRPLFDLSAARADSVQPGLKDDIEETLRALEADWPDHLPVGVIHADMFPDNVFFLKNDLSGVIDFYFACNDILAYDVAICLNAWCFEPDYAFNITKAKALLRGYQQVRPLVETERAALPVLARGAALRFLLTRLYDWLEVPAGALVTPHDPIEYWRKMRFHNSVASAADYGL
ncbi:MAG: homoserine kinase [Rhizobiales bacterium]|nr:homoserine kinase [Hyphomicrobiales bacterium]